jgi:hypothetical protein
MTKKCFACRDLGVVLDFDNVTSPCTVPACVDRRIRAAAVAMLSAEHESVGKSEEKTPARAIAGLVKGNAEFRRLGT